MKFFEMLVQDLRHGSRSLRKSPGFTAVAVLTLALGIGANSAIFSVVHAVLLAPLPYALADTRVMIWSKWKGWDKTWVSAREVLDYRERGRSFREVAAWDTGQVNLTGDGDPERIGAASVTANTFTALGATAMYGRTFSTGDDVSGRDGTVVLGHGLWRRRFGSDPSIIGRSIQIDGAPRTVVGIMPPGFRLPTDFTEDAAEPTELWTPLVIDPATAERGNHGLYAAAWLAPGVTAQQASAELDTIASNLTREGAYPADMQFKAFALSVSDEILGGVRPAVWLLFGAVGFLLLIACANVANLLLVRAEGRQREMALRSALGADQMRLVRQLLTESLLLSAAGAVLGLGLAFVGVRALAAWNLPTIPRAAAVQLDATVLLFTAITAVATSVLFGLAPAVRILRRDLTESLKEGSQSATAGRARQRFRAALVVVEMALAFVLMIGAGLMVRSLWALSRIDLGFEPADVLTLRVALPPATYAGPEQVIGFYDRLLDKTRTLPGVRSAGAVRSLPLAATIGDWGLDIEGFVETPGNNAKGDWQVVTDGAFEALGERLVAGRWFTGADTADSPPVAVVNETMAKTYWADANPMGKRIRQGDATRPWITVVGIAADERHNGVDAIVKEKFYRPHAQFHKSTGFAPASMTLVVRTAGDPLALAAPLRAEVARLDPNLPVAGIRTMDEVVSAAIATPRFTGWLLGLFAALALTLSSVGIYGVLAYLVSQRTREIGIRMAIGASRGQVLRLVLGRGAALAMVGVGAGIVLAALTTRLMSTLLHGVRPLDPATFAVVALGLTLVALIASYVPARRATRVDPLLALRSE